VLRGNPRGPPFRKGLRVIFYRRIAGCQTRDVGRNDVGQMLSTIPRVPESASKREHPFRSLLPLAREESKLA